ncbi:uncharacterized protein LOC144446320 [Glandiceps talaboti]
MDDESRKGVHVQTPKPGFLKCCADFANLYKTFFGAFFLSIPYGIRKSGIILGLLQIIMVVSLFYHACLVIIKCKKIVVQRLQASAPPNDEESDEEALEYLERHLTYMDIAQFSFGKIGKAVVDISLCVSQFSFCVGYLVFLGGVLTSFFCIGHQPITTETPAVVNETMIFYNLAQSGLDPSGWKFENISNTLTAAVVRRNYMSGIDGIVTRKANDDKSSERIQDNNNINVPGSFDLSLDDALRHSNLLESSTDQPVVDDDDDDDTKICYLWVLVPLPILILLSLLRNIRDFGIVSSVSLSAGAMALVTITVVLITALQVVSDDVVLFNWQSFLIMFGQVISTYEATAMIIPIESSMVGHRERFPIFLSIVITTYSTLLIMIGVLGYLVFGNDTEQVILDNLTNRTSSELLIFLQIALFLTVSLTYPMQMQPLIEVIEKILFTEGKICGPNSVEEERSLCVDDDAVKNQLHGAEAIPKSVAAWKRNSVRIALVLLTAIMAILLNDSFSYVVAFAGSTGGVMIGLILPSVFYLKLQWNQTSLQIKVLHFVIIIVCTTLGLICTVLVIKEVVYLKLNGQ